MNTEDLEKKLDEAVLRLEKRLEDMGRDLEARFSGGSTPPAERRTHRGKDSPFWGTLLVVLGFILLANHFDWFHLNIPILPAALIVLGLFLVIENKG